MDGVLRHWLKLSNHSISIFDIPGNYILLCNYTKVVYHNLQYIILFACIVYIQ